MTRTAADPTDLSPDGLSIEESTEGSNGEFRLDVQGLRAVAVVCVLLCHTEIPRMVNGGPIGVDVFFVVSGFVITGVLLRERQRSGRISILDFYGARARRIIPMAVLVIVAVVVIDRVIFGATLARSVEIQGRWDAMFQANFFYFQSLFHDFYQGPPPPANLGTALVPYWSLAVEEQFYLFYPAVVIALATIPLRITLRLRLGAVLIAVIAASYTWSVVSSHSSIVAYISTLTRAWELAVGALLAVALPWLKRLPEAVAAGMTWIGLAGIIIVALTFTLNSDWPGSAAAWPVAATALVIAGGSASPRYGAVVLLKLPPFQWLALWSFSLYLWNVPIQKWAQQLEGHLTLPAEGVVILIAIVLAALSYYFVENPIRRSALLKRSGITSLALGLALILSCVVLTLVI
jgi:peptidoglycan/LPS O-acetylase OafA/YrhL